jgi:hypothetical protein
MKTMKTIMSTIMKKNIKTKLFYRPVFCLLVLVFAGACSSLRVAESRSWHIGPEKKITGTVWIAGVQADKSGVRSSLENEAARLFPLFLSDYKYLAVNDPENADFIAEVKIREREYIRGWNTKYSLSAEVCFWPGKDAENFAALPPLAAGRVVLRDSGGLSSSITLGRLLEKTVKKAVQALEKK